ncbi:CRISPR-associated helicase/endonuclease Cas3 [Leptospira interrogans]|uniref:CRISPR-associated helicase/endonuclease Cas3 n=1 Tax=Leptospira interrogans TaxID=173 RepID=UPI000773A94C|nr:CRISPR-associated helicase/endonuclease Cas3 [Leptospira interrogans]
MILLAKSYPGIEKQLKSGDPESWALLEHHSSATYQVAEVLLKILEPILRKWTRLSESEYNKFVLVVCLSAGLHDLGKANEDFQKMLQRRKYLQRFRHEIWSVLALTGSGPFSDWFRKTIGDETWVRIGQMGILSHHLKATRETLYADHETAEIKVFWKDQGVIKMFQSICRLAGISSPDFSSPSISSYTCLGEDADKSIRIWTREILNAKIDPRYQHSIGAVRAMIIAADRLASAYKGADALKLWAEEALNRVLSEQECSKIVKQGLGEKNLRPFQKQVGDSTSRVTLVRAGCGNGKTIAAFQWAKTHSAGRKLFFCYPTMGTATEGFRDYVSDIPGLDALLSHSRASLDLGELASTGEEDEGDSLNMHSRMLQEWTAQVTFCTVDQILGLLQNYRSSLTLSPAIFLGAFVFDEIHMYDSILFGNLLTFLKEFSHTSILLMTASLPETMLSAIQETVGADLGPVISGEAQIEERLRYRILHSSREDALQKAIQEFKNGGRVLWVCNKVEHCLKLYDELSEKYDIEALVYHSRFKYEDRKERHRAVIDSFQEGYKKSLPVFAITTQVCEVSLDISATLLISELCPFAALIQRLGRVNRPGQEMEGIAQVLIIPFQGKPYEKENEDDGESELERCKEILKPLLDRELSQKDLALALENAKGTEHQKIPSQWLSLGWEAKPDSIRESGYTLDVILESDAYKVLKNERPWEKSKLYTIPMPIQKQFSYGEPPLRIPVVPDSQIQYSSVRGGEWNLN